MAGKPKKAADLRVPVPGNEVEFEAVSLTAIEKLDLLDRYLAHNVILDLVTKPDRPGLFSDALHDHLCKIDELAVEGVGLLRRLRLLCGDDSPHRTKSLRWRGGRGISSAEEDMRMTCDGLTEAEQTAVRRAAWGARQDAMAARVANSRSAEGCPKCGANTQPCKLDGDTRWMRIRTNKDAPARVCVACDAVTPNPTGKVLELVPTPRDLKNQR